MRAGKKTLVATLVGAAAATAFDAACSLILDFDENERPCAPDSDGDGLGECIEGYSCLVIACIKNGSVPEGSTCRVNAHCEAGHVCVAGLFTCRKECDSESDAENHGCPASMACVPKMDAKGSAAATCVPSECTLDEECVPKTNKICVPVRQGFGVCEYPCEIACTTDEGCSGKCGDESLTCQPLGMDYTLACSPAGTSTHGMDCNLVDELCALNSACMMDASGSTGTCLAYCDINEPPDAASACVATVASGAEEEVPLCEQVGDRPYGVCGQIPAQQAENTGQ